MQPWPGASRWRGRAGAARARPSDGPTAVAAAGASDADRSLAPWRRLDPRRSC